MIGLFLQVRLTSDRLPRKALLDLGGKPLIVQCIERLKRVRADIYAISTHDTSFDELKPIADAYGWGIIVGPEGDVLTCLRNAAVYYKTDTVIRATGDNPLVNPELFNWVVDYHMRTGNDLSGAAGISLGACGDVISKRALMVADSCADSRYDREHVTPFMRSHPDMFKIEMRAAPMEWRGNLRLTVDTMADYEAIKTYF